MNYHKSSCRGSRRLNGLRLASDKLGMLQPEKGQVVVINFEPETPANPVAAERRNSDCEEYGHPESAIVASPSFRGRPDPEWPAGCLVRLSS